MRKLKRGNKRNIISKNKNGQFFILVAVIVCLIILILIKEYNYIRESVELQDYNELRDQYNREVPKVMNRAIYITTDPAQCSGSTPLSTCPVPAVQGFSEQYQKYASQKDPNFGLVSIIRDPTTGNIIVQNLLANTPDGKPRYIKIDASQYGGKGIKLLWSEDTQLEGTITINGLGDMYGFTAHAPLSSLSQNLTKMDVGNVQKFEVYIEGSDIPLTIDLSEYAGKVVTSSSDPRGNVALDVCPSIIPNNNC